MEALELVVYFVSGKSKLKQQKWLTLLHLEIVCLNTISDALLLIKKEQVLTQFGSAISKKPTANK